MSSHVENFRDAIRAAGMMPPDAIEPGRIYRFPGVGKANGNGAGWCNLFPDGMGGSFGDWSTGLSENWQARRERPISLAEREAFREQVARAQAESEAERKRTQAEAATQAAERWQQGEPAPVDHPYLVRKGIQPNGARVLGATLLVPMRDGSGALCNVQRIPPEGGGKKLFQFGARVNGCYFAIGKTNGVIHIAEGFATGASVHEATGEAVAVAFSAGNLDAVARTLRTKYPQARIVMCADDDYQTAANTGLTKATEAALAVGGLVAKPDFGIVRPDGAKDFNDLHQLHGAEAVRGAIASAAAPKLSQIQPAAPSATAGDLDDRVWPDALDNAALHGIAGEFVRMVEPNTEADPAAILLQFLAAFGALVGRGPHYLVEGDEHHANLYVLLVGATAKGRKGTSWGRVRQIFERMTDWKPHASGLSSGEGITQESPSWATGSGPIHRAIKPTNCRLSNRLLSK